MEDDLRNAAFIDSANLHQAIKDLGWTLDYRKFRVFLRDKYRVGKAYLFIGFLETQQALYANLQEYGFILIFRPTLRYKDGHTKGNCDADLVLKAMVEYGNYEKAVIVSGDGDFYSFIDHLKREGKLAQVLVPNESRYSALLKKINEADAKYFSFISRMRQKLEYRKAESLQK
jgi:uncharacterized LabA/DUF88 family protein